MRLQRPESAGLLIVNADDLGGHQLATDRTFTAFEAGAITSATAMVFMQDSERAATEARSKELPAGLHLNLTQRFDGAAVPPAVAARQARIVRYMAHPRRRRFGFAPQLVMTVKAALEDQLERFRELYGREPTHIDGHNHVHLNPTVLHVLPGSYAVRPGYDPTSASPVRLLRRARNRKVRRRHPTVGHFFALTSLHPALGGHGLEQALRAAGSGSVELMVHPAEDRVFEVLLTDDWRRRIAEEHLGSYRDLVAAGAAV